MILACIVLLVSFIVYISVIDSGFIWDDTELLYKPIKSTQSPYSFFFQSATFYRPLLHMSMALDYSLWGLDPAGYHLTNIILHMINALLVFVLCYQILKYNLNITGMDRDEVNEDKVLTLSFLSTMVFILHPVHIESVAWISGRTDLLATLFVILAFLSFMIYEREGRVEALVLSCVFFIFGLFSKENAISFIGIALVYGIILKMPKKKIVIAACMMMLVLVIYFVFRNGMFLVAKLTAPPGSKGAFFSGGVTPVVIISKLIMGIGYYIEKLVLPFKLSLIPMLPESPLYFFVVVAYIIVCILFYLNGKKIELYLLVWIVIALSPSLLILFSKISEPLGERYLYLPSVGFALLPGIFMSSVKSRGRAYIIMICIVIISATAFALRIPDWRSDLFIWEDTVKKNPLSVHARLNYGAALVRKGEYEKAENELQLVARGQGMAGFHRSIAYNLLGTLKLESGDLEGARRHLIYSIEENSRNSAAHFNLAIVFDRMSLLDENIGKEEELIGRAINYYQKARDLSPGFIMPTFNIGLSYLRLGHFDDAVQYFQEVIDIDPNSSLAEDAARLLHLIRAGDSEKIEELISRKFK